ncbi:DUF2975 family protein [Litorimonas taeanensis]|uniref:DUF2975 family protein n=1 Tax=Litorimonas taeanensis TaxID=568099 RepID=A0A420WL41_9PROT|nr:DUF2975 domain-containing protein [Litorimonas taeanensis]RKQ71605.1 DUF2975 family protein [Litorimonas taeanensis]
MTENLSSANDMSDYDFNLDDQSGNRMARILQLGTLIGRIVLGLAVFVTLVAALWMALSTGFQDELFKTVGMENTPSHLLLPATCLVLAVIAAAWFWVLHILSKIVDTLISGDPFVPMNIGRLRRMWIIIALTEVFRMVVVNMTGAFFPNSDDSLKIRIGVWFLVFVIATLSEAFRYGAIMRRDQELTI